MKVERKEKTSERFDRSYLYGTKEREKREKLKRARELFCSVVKTYFQLFSVTKSFAKTTKKIIVCYFVLMSFWNKFHSAKDNILDQQKIAAEFFTHYFCFIPIINPTKINNKSKCYIEPLETRPRHQSSNCISNIKQK